MYCKAGDKPRVLYSFSGENSIIFQSQVAPIDVKVKEGSPLVKGERYVFRPVTTLNPRPPAGDLIFVHPVTLSDITVQRIGKIETEEYFGRDYGLWRGTAIDDTGRILPNVTQYGFFPQDILRLVDVDQIENPKSTIEIFNDSGALIHSATGKGSVTFEVICGRCRDSEIECKCDRYPFYCCIPCEPLIAKINNIYNRLRR